jgi:hypothetical protein
MIDEERVGQIVDEVFSLLNAPDIFAHLAGNVETDALELRLREVMQSRQSLMTEELVVYLRSSFVASDRLPTWQPLLNAAIEQCRMRGEDMTMFYGMLPPEQVFRRNTGNPITQKR